jgi:hypothetical protein
MPIHQRVQIERTSFARGEVEIDISIFMVDENGRIVGYQPIQKIRALEPEGAWVNADIEAILRRERILTSKGGPEIAAVPEVKDPITGDVLRPALPAIPARSASWKPMLDEGDEVVWM